MENYNQMGQENTNNGNKSSRSNFPPYAATPLVITTANHHHMNNNDSGGGADGGGGGDYFQSALVVAEDNPNNIVKSETSHPHHHQPPRFYNYPLLISSQPSDHHRHQHLHLHPQHPDGPLQQGRNCDLLAVGGGGRSSSHGNHRSSGGNTTTNNNNSHNEVEVMKAKIIAHPQYSSLLQAYMDCQKVGAPPEVAARLTAILQEFETKQRISSSSSSSSKDPELDQFMEAYYDMLVKYREELTRPVQEAIEFMTRIESQLNLITNGRARVYNTDEKSEGNMGSSDEEQDNSGGETELPEIDPRSEDRELKNHLLRKYSGYLSSLKQELSKKKKKGKLPKEARQKLLSWWELHYKWPYPSESEKVALAEATGLDQKQINNWFINQRKRHWKPSEDMQFMVMDGIHPQNAALYMEGHYLGDGPYRFGT